MNRKAVVARVLCLRALSEPRVAVVVLALLVLGPAVALAASRIDDPDVWWLVAAGRDILARGAVPQVNGYAFTAPTYPWVMHEWLYGVYIAWGFAHLGPCFLSLVAVVNGTAFQALALTRALGEAKVLASAVLVALLLAAIAPFPFLPRPSAASLTFAMAMVALAFPAGWSLTRTALAVALESLWTQTHGSFALGLVLLGAAAFERRADGAERRSRVAGIVLCGLVTFVNPYGSRLHGLVRHYVLGDDDATGMIHRQIAEFQPLWGAGGAWAGAPSIVALAAVMALAASALTQGRHRARAGVTLAMAALAIGQARHVALAVALGATLLVVEVDDLLADFALPPLPFARPWLVGVAALCPALLVGAVTWGVLARVRPADDWIDESLGGAVVAKLARALPDGAHVYAPFLASAVVLETAAPHGGQVFFDPRNDCYPADVFLAAVDVQHDAAADRLLVVRGADHAIVPQASPLAATLQASPLWSAEQTAGSWRLFRRSAASPHVP